MHSLPWKDISDVWRTLYAYALLPKILLSCDAGEYETAMRTLDEALIMCGSEMEELDLHEYVAYIQTFLPITELSTIRTKKPKREEKQGQQGQRPIDEHKKIKEISLPSLECFETQYMITG